MLVRGDIKAYLPTSTSTANPGTKVSMAFFHDGSTRRISFLIQPPASSPVHNASHQAVLDEDIGNGCYLFFLMISAYTRWLRSHSLRRSRGTLTLRARCSKISPTKIGSGVGLLIGSVELVEYWRCSYILASSCNIFLFLLLL